LTLWLPVTYEADARDWMLSTLLMSALLMEPVCIWVPVAPGASIAVAAVFEDGRNRRIRDRLASARDSSRCAP
jgi:hypothetical protein